MYLCTVSTRLSVVIVCFVLSRSHIYIYIYNICRTTLNRLMVLNWTDNDVRTSFNPTYSSSRKILKASRPSEHPPVVFFFQNVKVHQILLSQYQCVDRVIIMQEVSYTINRTIDVLYFCTND